MLFDLKGKILLEYILFKIFFTGYQSIMEMSIDLIGHRSAQNVTLRNLDHIKTLTYVLMG